MRSDMHRQALRLGAIVGLFTVLLSGIAGAAPARPALPPDPALSAAGRPFQKLPSGPANRPPHVQPAAAPQGPLVWTPLGGPTYSGGQVTALAVHPAVSETLYAAVQGAPDAEWDYPTTIYQSADGAASWTAAYTVPHGVRSLAATGSRVYAGAYNRDDGRPLPVIYCSTDGGLNWTAPLSLSNGTIWTIGVHPDYPDVAAAGGGDYPDTALLYRTTNAGADWTAIFSYTLPGASPTVNAVLINPAAPTVWLFAHDGDVGGGLGSYTWRSVNAGTDWTPVFTLTGDLVSSFAVHPVTPTIVYAGTYQNNLYRSADGGATWTAVITDGSAGRQIVAEPPDTLYAITEDQVRRSTDGGASWEFAGWQGRVRALAIDLGPTPTALYAGLGGVDGIIRSTDGGANWEPRNDGLASRARPHDLDVDPADPTRLFVAAECAGSFRSTDGGATWASYSDLGMLPGCMGAFGINARDPSEVYAGGYNCGGGTIYRSIDGGDSFTPVFTPTYVITDCSNGGENIYALGPAPSLSSTVYAVGVDYPGWADGYGVVVRSLDHGASWTNVFTLSAPSEVVAGVINPQDDTTAYIGGTDCSAGPCQGFIYRTTDHGAGWKLVLTETSGIRSIVVDYQKPWVLYAATDGYRVYKSTDAGDTWAVVRYAPWEPGGDSSGNYLAIDPHVPSHLYLGGWNYVAESTDSGVTWSAVEDPLNQGTPPLNPSCLRVDRDPVTQTLYAGFDGTWSYSRPAPQPGGPATIEMGALPPGGVSYANCMDPVLYRGLVLDADENWVANNTPVTVTYDMRDFGLGEFTTVKRTANGVIGGGFFSCGTGTITFTAVATVTATDWVTGTFLYNAPSGITVTGAPISMTVGGATGIVTATVPGLHGGRASDGTVVTWETTLGTVVTTTLTVSGVATTTLTTGSLAGTAVITAAAGSFTDTVTVDFVGGWYYVYLPVVLR